MKTKILTLIVTALAVVSCSAMPPVKKPSPAPATVALTIAAMPVGAEAINYYNATTNDMAWTRIGTGGPAAVVSQPLGTTRIYTVEATNSVGEASDYAPFITVVTPADKTTVIPVPVSLVATNK